MKVQRTLITAMNKNHMKVSPGASTAHALSHPLPATLYRKEPAAASTGSGANGWGLSPDTITYLSWPWESFLLEEPHLEMMIGKALLMGLWNFIGDPSCCNR